MQEMAFQKVQFEKFPRGCPWTPLEVCAFGNHVRAQGLTLTFDITFHFGK